MKQKTPWRQLHLVGCTVVFLLIWLCGMTGSAMAETWDAGGAPDLSWGNNANWDTAAPANPATSLITFNTAGSVGVGTTNATSRLNQDRTLNAGMTCQPNSTRHNIDLGGYTLTFNGGTLTATKAWESVTLSFTNGTLILGQPAGKANLTVGFSGSSGNLMVNCSFSNNLNDVKVGYEQSGNGATGYLDLRGSTPQERSFKCASLTVGCYIAKFGAYGIGTLYLNDAGGQITNLTVESSFNYGCGTIAMNAGTTIDIGTSSSARATMLVGNSNGGDATLTPLAALTAYLSSLTMGNLKGTGTLDLTNAPGSMLDVAGTVNLGYNSPTNTDNPTYGGRGVMRLGNNTSASFTNLLIGVNTTVTNNQLLVRGGVLTIGNNNTSVFQIAATNTLTLDFSDPATQLKVYGNYASSGPATNINTYIADGRIVIVNGNADIGYDGTNSYVRPQRNTATMIIVE